MQPGQNIKKFYKRIYFSKDIAVQLFLLHHPCLPQVSFKR